ncbi:MAG TPA: hypothetical protein VE309_05610 [Caulobacteraceae bacterium]|jgi:hypothetical protein|nr:hypothetical protein [Caulobacteraceae bacterium]
MPSTRRTRSASSFDDALARLKRDGGPVPVSQEGETVAMMLTPVELERLEDERDRALLRASMAHPDNEGRVGLDALAVELGIPLDHG